MSTRISAQHRGPIPWGGRLLLAGFCAVFVCRAEGVIVVGQEPSSAGDVGWPHWRGPFYDGTSGDTGLASDWPDSGPPVLWARDIGVGYSGFAALGDRVFTLTQTPYSQYDSLAAPAAFALYRPRRWQVQMAWVAAAYSCYYWTSASVNGWLK